MTHYSVLHAIGNTPLVKVAFKTQGTVFAKLEYINPSGSVKDRSALYMIEQAEQQGLLKPGGTIIDASSGNHGVALAMIGAIKGYRVIITVSEKISLEKLQTIQAYGAETVVCPATSFIEDPRSYHSVACKLAREIPNSYMPNQYFSVVNADGHYHSLGPEIWRQTEGKITHFIAGAGTGGTISGAGRYLKEQNPAIKVIGIDTATSWRATKGNPQPYKIEGIGIDFASPALNLAVIDEIIAVSDEQGLGMLPLLARTYGLLGGPSSGAIAYAAQEYAKKLTERDVIVMIFGDSGRAYLSKNFYGSVATSVREPQVSACANKHVSLV
jgi:cystathionine beta-synthase